MNINSVNYDESYLEAIAQVQAITSQQTAQTNAQTDKTTESARDSYISSITNTDTAIPSGTYGADGMEVVDTFSPVTTVNTDSDTSANQNAAVSGGSGGAGGGDSSDSDEDTETELVTINGVTYLQTTTTDESGNTTVTRTRIGTASENNTDKSSI
jgi:hypothetical protein